MNNGILAIVLIIVVLHAAWMHYRTWDMRDDVQYLRNRHEEWRNLVFGAVARIDKNIDDLRVQYPGQRNDMKEKLSMGTRGFIGFVVDGVEKIAYNHFDSYPAGLGADIRDWLFDIQPDRLEECREQARSLRVVTDATPPTKEDVEAFWMFADLDVDKPLGLHSTSWYQLLRKTQGRPDVMLKVGVIEDASSFPMDSLFAEWGYVIDFDLGVLEVYKGFQEHEHAEGRFAGRQVPTQPGRSYDYAPVKLVHSWPLTDLPATNEEFVAALEPRDD